MAHAARISLAVALALAILFVGAWRTPGARSATLSPAQIDRAIEQLGDESYQVRQAASRQLWEAGKAAEPALQKACASPDREVADRARRIQTKLRWEIYPDTPAETVAAINLFRKGDEGSKLRACQRLVRLGDARRVFRLIALIPDSNSRERLFRQFQSQLDEAVSSLLEQGDFDGAEQVLQSSPNEQQLAAWAALLLIRQKLDPAIEETRSRLGQKAEPLQQRRLAYLLRAKGDVRGALDAAEKADDPSLVDDLLFRLGRWGQLAKRIEANASNGPMQSSEINRLGYLATYHRLAGDKKALDRDAAKLLEHGRTMPNESWFAAKALLINGRVDDALDLCATKDRRQLFEILCVQGRYREAFRRVGLGEPPAARKDSMAAAWAKDAVAARKDYELGCEAARVLERLGEHAAAVEFADQMGALASGVSGTRRSALLASLCRCEVELKLDARAVAHAMAIFGRRPEDCPYLYYGLFGAYGQTNEIGKILWGALREQYPDESEGAILKRLRDLLADRPSESSIKELRRLAERADNNLVAAGNGPQRRERSLLAISSFFAARHCDALAVRYARKAAAESGSSQLAAIQLGNLLAARGNWADAARAYQAAVTKNARDPVALYLLGRANLRRGKEAEGHRQVETASMMLSLGGGYARWRLIDCLGRAKRDDEARSQCELTIRLVNSREWVVSGCRQSLANLASQRGDHLAAADYWEKLLAPCIETSRGFAEAANYIRLPSLIHRERARGLLKAGKYAEALEELRKAESVQPADPQVAFDIVPELQRAGRRADADALFRRAFDRQAAICRDFPRSALHHNSLAWMAACCKRELDKALVHARRAVELDPKASYIDTLAEVHFRRGEVDEAIRQEKRALQLDPDYAYLKRQLERFTRSLERGAAEDTQPPVDEERRSSP
ncbi:MAG: tetratricopeptide repeat protein [Thermoguttaceae bacterium]